MAMAYPPPKERRFLPQHAALDVNQQKEFKKNVTQAKKGQAKVQDDAKSGRGVVYLGHIPHGFTEEGMNAYFSQFGDVLRLRLARSKKTGNPKGYAFIEFESEAVAKIVAESMNNYLMFNKLMKCQFVPQDKLHRGTFVGCNTPFKASDRHLWAIKRHNAPLTEERLKKKIIRLQKRTGKALSKLKDMGIECDITGQVLVTKPTEGEDKSGRPDASDLPGPSEQAMASDSSGDDEPYEIPSGSTLELEPDTPRVQTRSAAKAKGKIGKGETKRKQEDRSKDKKKLVKKQAVGKTTKKRLVKRLKK